MLTLSELTKIVKRYSRNPSISNEEALNALLEPYIIAGCVKERNGLNFYLDKHRTSKLLNGKCDVPINLRKVIARVGLEKETADNFDVFFDEVMDIARFRQFAEEVSAQLNQKVQIECNLYKELNKRISNPCEWMAHVLLAVIKTDNRAEKEWAIWQCGTGSLRAKTGDLFQGCFGKPTVRQRIVVIPVNTTFDTKITWDYENDPKPLVSERTIHGQWIKRMINSGISEQELSKRLDSNLQTLHVQPIALHGRGTSPKPEYPLGTVAAVSNKRAVFYLLAISVFNENNNAQSTREQLAASIDKLISFYDIHGQGLDLYLPLMGTGMSRASLSHQESYDLAVSALTKNKEQIHGKVTIVIYKGDAEKVTVPEEVCNYDV